MRIEQITAWKDSEGKLYESEEAAINAQIDINLKESLAKILEEEYFCGMSLDSVIFSLMERKEEIKVALSKPSL